MTDHLVGKINAFFQLLSPRDEQFFICQIFMIADHVQRMLRAHQRRRDGDLPAAGGVRNETRPGAGSCDSARERGSARGHGTQGSDVRRTRAIATRCRRRARGSGAGRWLREATLTVRARPWGPARSPLPLVWLMSVRSSQLLRADPPESPFGYAGSAESIFSYELRHKTNMLFDREHDQSGEWPR